MDLVVSELTADLWPALEELFATTGAVGRCWCMYWRIGSQYRERESDINKEAFRKIVQDGPPPGLLAFDDCVVVGWCQLTPRAVLPWLERSWRLQRLDETPVWSISCFYVRKKYRKKGVATALIGAALETAKRAGAPAVEAYPIDAGVSPSTSHTGYASTFARMGFKTVARHAPARPIMRFEFHSAD